MAVTRYLCSELITIARARDKSIVNLEEIWETGAFFEAETAIEKGETIDLLAREKIFRGQVKNVERHEFGWRVEMEFSPPVRWSVDDFRPQHMLDPNNVKARP
jgi:hypothetical protein